MGLNQGELYSPSDIQSMKDQLKNIDAQLNNLDKLQEVNSRAGSTVYDLSDERERLNVVKTQLQAIIDVFG